MSDRHRHLYRLKAIWTGAAQGPTLGTAGYSRDVRVEIAGKPALLASADTPFRGDPTRHNPEDLLLASLSVCHMLSYLHLAARAGIAVATYEDEANAVLDLKEGRLRIIEATLQPFVAIASGGERDKAERLHSEAHDQCFIANSVAFPVRWQATIRVG